MHSPAVQVDTHDQVAPVSIWSRRYRLLTLGLLLTVVVFAFEALSVATTMPATMADLGGLQWYGWVFSVYMLMMIIGITIAGSETDCLGPRRPYLAGATLFVIGLAAAGLAPSMPLLIVARAIQGLGAGLLASIAYVIVGRGYPEASRPHMLALISSAYVVPSLIGPALAGFIADHLGWRWVFLGLAPALPLTAPFIIPALQRLEQPAASQPRDWQRIGAAIRVAAGSGLLVSGMSAHQMFILTIILVAVGLGLILPALRYLLSAGAAPGKQLSLALLSGLLLNMAFSGWTPSCPLRSRQCATRPPLSLDWP